MPAFGPEMNKTHTFVVGDRVTLHPQVSRPGMRRNLKVVGIEPVPSEDRAGVGHSQWVRLEQPDVPLGDDGESFSGAWCFKEGTPEAEEAKAWYGKKNQEDQRCNDLS